MNTDARPSIRQDALIAQAYVTSRAAVCGYIYKRIGSAADAEDLTQEVFARLVECTTLLNEKTLVGLVYSMARNRVVDYLRRRARSRAAADYFFIHARRAACDTEERVAAAEVEAMEAAEVGRMSPRRAQVWSLCVREGLTADEAAGLLRLGRRTVENHLYAARCELRAALGECI